MPTPNSGSQNVNGENHLGNHIIVPSPFFSNQETDTRQAWVPIMVMPILTTRGRGPGLPRCHSLLSHLKYVGWTFRIKGKKEEMLSNAIFNHRYCPQPFQIACVGNHGFHYPLIKELEKSYLAWSPNCRTTCDFKRILKAKQNNENTISICSQPYV